ncbi:32831_t:CDS:1, partial [Racocetra persica]
KYGVIYDVTSAYFSDNEDSKCEFNEGYRNVPDVEEKSLLNEQPS